MNYYQDSRFDCSMNNRNQYYDNVCDSSKEYSGRSFGYKDYCNGNNKHSCCLRKVEETLCCFPSYYTEEEKKECGNCWEGTFKICPKHENNDKEEKCYNKNSNKNEEHKYTCHHNKCCGFCDLFRRW